MPLLHPGVVCCWTSLPHFVVGEAVPELYWGTSCTHTFERLLDLDGLQRAELTLPVGFFQ